MSKFNVGDEVLVDLFGDGVYRPAKVTNVNTGPGKDVYTVDVETCTANAPDCIQRHNGYVSNDDMTRAR